MIIFIINLLLFDLTVRMSSANCNAKLDASYAINYMRVRIVAFYIFLKGHNTTLVNAKKGVDQ